MDSFVSDHNKPKLCDTPYTFLARPIICNDDDDDDDDDAFGASCVALERLQSILSLIRSSCQSLSIEVQDYGLAIVLYWK